MVTSTGCKIRVKYQSPVKTAFTLFLVATFLGSCAVYNEECARFMDDPDGTAGYLNGEVSIAREDVRLKDNVIGQLVAEAYYNAFGNQSTEKRPRLSIVNGGSIRSDGICETRSSLARGEVKRKVLRDILPYDNRVILTTITAKELKNVFEHGVANYSRQTPPGSYLQVAGARVTIDCNKQAEKFDSNNNRIQTGERVQSIRLRQLDCKAALEDDCYGDPIDMTSSEEIYMALDSYIFGGGDNFSGFGDKKDEAGTYNFEIVAQYFFKNHPAESPRSIIPEERVTLLNCKTSAE